MTLGDLELIIKKILDKSPGSRNKTVSGWDTGEIFIDFDHEISQYAKMVPVKNKGKKNA